MSTLLLSLKIEFSGGLELLFSNQRSHRVQIPSIVPIDNSTSPSAAVPASDISMDLPTSPQSTDTGKTKAADITYLMYYLRDHLLKERVELFMEGGTVRPGILVLINDTDWELEGEGEYILKDRDEVVFISTLHGG
ncbi:hypothetical protein PILCRDRAFT_810207 [Piloderma croceum F 1598]|uniref:Ubiquitin-related modifier 1 n=1 Tax=Piloderma croceum (strain F 1598) TaxID=765440 RepID=A0A0C3CRB7_PILCF|nr:hypothetical protein PILCRDRAFT_810207 [Piloderma croceum F 1598]